MLLAYAGKIKHCDLTQFIKPAYHNFDNLAFDVSGAKTIIKDFIVNYCKTQRYPDPPDDIGMYKMSVYGNYGIVFEVKGYRCITYLINGATGAVYVAEHVPNTSFYMAPVDFDFLLIMHRNSGATLHTHLLSPLL
jgi:hypothetical protein